MVSDRIAALRALMKKKGIDAYMIPTDDYHASEYVGEYFKCRQYMTSFTGSAGTAVITQDMAGMWTDARYFIQAERQMEGSGVVLYRMREPGVPTVHEFLAQTLKKGQRLGFDGRCVGDVALERKENVYARDADIGYVLLDKYRGQELMTEAVGRICAEAFDALDLLRVTARVCAPNLASRRVLEKNGFALEGAMRRAVCKGGEVFDLLIYGKLR